MTAKAHRWADGTIFGLWGLSANNRGGPSVEGVLSRMVAGLAKTAGHHPTGDPKPPPWACHLRRGGMGWSGGTVATAARGRLRVVVKGFPETRDAPHDHLTAEAILTLYAQHSDAFLDRIGGAFLIMLEDGNRGRLILANDRAGVEPLYIAENAGMLYFASRMGCLTQLGDLGGTISANALYAYLYFSRVPAPQTIYTDIAKLGAGCRVVAEAGAWHIDRYWLPRYTAERTGGGADRARLRKLMDGAIRRTADAHDGQTVGAFLSGGLDSSTVSVLLNRHLGDRAPLVHVSFAEEAYDESAYARAVAEGLSSPYHELKMMRRDLKPIIDRLGRAYDEPFGNSSAAAAHFAAQGARAAGIDVLIGGDGGDELFGGNERYRLQKIFELYYALPKPLREGVAAMMMWRGLPGGFWPIRKAQSYLRRARTPLPGRLHTYNFYEDVGLAALLTPAYAEAFDPDRGPHTLMEEHYFRVDGDTIDRMMYLDLQTTIVDDDIRKVQTTCADNGILARFPFLYDEIMAFAAEIPGRRHVPGYALRDVFRKAAAPLLPEATLKKSKRGFGLPFGVWLREDRALYDEVRGTLESLRDRSVITGHFLDRFRAQFDADKGGRMGQDMWVLVMLEKWFQHHHDPATKAAPAPQPAPLFWVNAAPSAQSA